MIMILLILGLLVSGIWFAVTTLVVQLTLNYLIGFFCLHNIPTLTFKAALALVVLVKFLFSTATPKITTSRGGDK